MTLESLPPDARLANKVKIVPLDPKAHACNGNDGRHDSFACDVVNEKSPTIDDDAEIRRLAKLGKLEYERERTEAAKQLNVRKQILDRLIRAERHEFDEKQGRTLTLDDPEPWPDPVNGANLFDDLSAAIRRHIVMPDWAADTVALWAAHSYLVDCFGISPRLALTSPEKGCGQTTLLDVLSSIVIRPLSTANATASVIFRVVEVRRPTLLIDEADTFLSEKEELRGILNSGHRQGGSVIRTVGEDFEPRSFSTFAACAIALIGKLPSTISDRSVPIKLRRRRADEPAESFRFDRTEHLDRLRRKLARWAADVADRVRETDPDMPAGMFNRAADNWRPLLAIADVAGAARGRRALGERSNLLRRPATMTNPPASPCWPTSAQSLQSGAPTACHPPN
jgi:putative DNA primase/helicase